MTEKNDRIKQHWVGHKDYDGVEVNDNYDNIELLNYKFIKDVTIRFSGDLKKKNVFSTEFWKEIMARNKHNKPRRIPH